MRVWDLMKMTVFQTLPAWANVVVVAMISQHTIKLL
jgi:hypothetical protein